MIIFYDTETTGLPKAETAPLSIQPYITEFCAIKTDEDLNVIGTYTQLFKVPVDIEKLQPGDKKTISEMTGITNAMLADKNPFAAHYKEIAEFFCGSKKLVAHNIAFDRNCLKFELLRLNKLLNFPWPIEHECTVEQSMHIKGYRLNLGALHEHLYGEKFEGAHRAEADVQALIRCYKKMKEQ